MTLNRKVFVLYILVFFHQVVYPTFLQKAKSWTKNICIPSIKAVIASPIVQGAAKNIVIFGGIVVATGFGLQFGKYLERRAQEEGIQFDFKKYQEKPVDAPLNIAIQNAIINIEKHKFIILEGKSGVGKTYSVRLVAKQLDAFYLTKSTSEICIAAFAGQRSGQIISYFGRLKKYANANADKKYILALDEIDTLSTRNTDFPASQEDAHGVNAFLTAIDDLLEHTTNIYIIGTTNDAKRIDPAVISRSVAGICTVESPDREAIKRYLFHDCNQIPLKEDEQSSFKKNILFDVETTEDAKRILNETVTAKSSEPKKELREKASNNVDRPLSYKEINESVLCKAEENLIEPVAYLYADVSRFLTITNFVSIQEHYDIDSRVLKRKRNDLQDWENKMEAVLKGKPLEWFSELCEMHRLNFRQLMRIRSIIEQGEKITITLLLKSLGAIIKESKGTQQRKQYEPNPLRLFLEKTYCIKTDILR